MAYGYTFTYAYVYDSFKYIFLLVRSIDMKLVFDKSSRTVR